MVVVFVGFLGGGGCWYCGGGGGGVGHQDLKFVCRLLSLRSGKPTSWLLTKAKRLEKKPRSMCRGSISM